MSIPERNIEANLHESEWRYFERRFLEPARALDGYGANAVDRNGGEWHIMAGFDQMVASEYIVATHTEPMSGNVTSYCLAWDSREISQVVMNGEEFQYMTPDTTNDELMGELQLAANDAFTQTDFGLDIPVGDDLKLLRQLIGRNTI